MRSTYKLSIIIVLVALFFGAQRSSASHLAGGQITYVCNGNNSYTFTASIYRDCQGIAISPPSLTLTCGNGTTYTLPTPTQPTPILVNQPCGVTGTTTCNGGTLPGIQRYDYVITYTVPATCLDWRVSFNVSARNAALQNLAAGQNLYLESSNLINSATTCNNSIQFNDDPILFVCAGQQFCYNAGATDPDADSLSYGLVCPEIAYNTCAMYNGNFSFPNNQYDGTISIDSVTGIVCMTPNSVQIFVFAYQVYEWRRINGVMTLVGQVRRDLQVYVQACSNTLPSLTGVDSTTSHTFNICGGSNGCFKIYSSDPDANQWLRDSLLNLSSGLNLTFDTTQYNTSINGTHEPIVLICVYTTAAQIGHSYTFSMVVRDNNCPTNGTNIASYTINVNGLTAVSSSTPVSCFGGNDGTATATVTTGTNFTYLWSNGQTTSTAINLTAGTYTVTITEISGCTATASAPVAQGPLLTASTSTVDVSCAGGHNGRASATIVGGTAPFTYLWSPVQQTSQTATGLYAGTYSVVIIDSHGCTASQTATINEPPALSVDTSNFVAPDCVNLGSLLINASGGTGSGYTYFINTNPIENSNIITNLGAGNYTITVRDANGCRVSMSIVITAPHALFMTTATTDVSCNGGNNGTASTTTTLGTGNYLYVWTNSVSTTDRATGLSAGSYSVTVTDANGGCTTSANFTITEPTAVSVSSSFSPIACNGGTSSVIITAGGGTPPYIGDGTFTEHAGTFNYIVQDSHNCSASTSVTITEPTLLVASVVETVPIACNGGMATVVVSETGGTGPYTGDGTFSVGAGTYSYTVTDLNGCTANASITINEPPALSVQESHVDVVGCVCTGFTPGSVSVTASGGTGAYTYVWTPNVSNGSSATGLSAGTYTIDVFDANNCSITISSTVGGPNPMSITLTHVDATCEGGLDGSATAIVTGGTLPYTYLWIPSAQTGATLAGVGAGMYVVRVQDATGCTVFNTTAIGYQHARPNVDLGRDTSVCASSNYTLDAGAGFVSYIWSDGSAAQTLVVTSTGTYDVTVTDVNGCQNEDGVHVTVLNCMVIGGNHDGARLATAAQGMTAIVYPNPAHDVVNVAISGIKSEITVKVEMNDILGNKVFSQTAKSDSNYLTSIKLDDMPAGIYFLQVQFDNQIKTIKVVKQ